MRRTPKISVIIPFYNSARYIREAIESVLGQTYQSIEIILVDDGSKEGIMDIVSNLDGRLQYLRQDNRGPSAARNAGIEMARGEYLVFLDADDLLLPKKLEWQTRYLNNNPEVDVVYSSGYCINLLRDGTEELIPFSKKGYLQKSLGSPKKSLAILLIQNAFPINAAMARKRAVVDVGGFDEELIGLEDWDLWLRVAEKHYFAYLDGYVAKYRLVNGGVSTNFDLQKRAHEKLECKIELANWFPSLPSLLRSDFYFCWGLQWLEFEEPPKATERFRKAIEVDPRNLLVRAAYLLTKLMGTRAAFFYHLKRKTLGVRRNF